MTEVLCLTPSGGTPEVCRAYSTTNGYKSRESRIDRNLRVKSKGVVDIASVAMAMAITSKGKRQGRAKPRYYSYPLPSVTTDGFESLIEQGLQPQYEKIIGSWALDGARAPCFMAIFYPFR